MSLLLFLILVVIMSDNNLLEGICERSDEWYEERNNYVPFIRKEVSLEQDENGDILMDYDDTDYDDLEDIT